jgi:threonine/homoserine/homoserine lactone efflux protein
MENFAAFLLLRGVSLGFSAAALPGPLQGYLMNTTLKHGWRRALYVVVSPLIVDIPIVLAVLLALETMAAFVPRVVDGVRIAGGLFVLYLAWGAWQDFRRGGALQAAAAEQNSTPDTPRSTFSRALLMNAISPGPYLFWTTVNGPLLQDALSHSVLHGVMFIVAFYGTFLSLLALLAVLLARLSAIDERLTRGMVLAAALLLTVLGAVLLYEGVTSFL